MNCPFCNAINAEGAVRCTHCSQVMGNPGGAETLAVDPDSTRATQTLPRTQREAIGVATPPPYPSPNTASGDRPPYTPGMLLQSGESFGPRYRIESLLGRGGMGVVYKAYDLELDRTVALKLVRPDLTFDPESMRRFKQELLLASRVSHKNILRIHDLGDVQGVKFISMAYVEGEDLHHLLKRQRCCPAGQILSIGRQLAAALDAAHHEGVVHRDLKPQNVLMDREGQAFVMDFGLAKSLEADASMMTHAGAILGTPRYMSPEQVEGKPADHRSDIYALGLILYEMATGDIPFSGESVTQLMMQRITQKVKDPKLLNSDLPKHLSTVILRCLETDPARRYQSAREIERELGGAPSSKPAFSRSSVQITLAVPASRRWRFVMAAALILAALAVAWVAYKLTRLRPVHHETAVTGVPPLTQGKFLAVLPFHVLGNQASLGYLAEGLGEALNAKLFALNGVHIVSPGAVEQAAKQGSLATVAKELGVNLAVEGTLQGGNGKIAVIVNLEDVSSGRLLWAREFTGVPEDLLTLEDEISGKLIAALALHPGSRELAQESQHPTENVAAYDLYLKGREALRGLPNAETIQKAIGLYKDALKQDPSFALVYAGLADANLRMYNQTKDRIWVDEATQAAGQAQQLNSNLPEVYIALGNVYSATGKSTQAIDVLKRAVSLAPNSDEGYRQLGKAYESNGQLGMAIAAFIKACQIDPYYWFNADELGGAYGRAGQFENALREFQRVIQLEPDNDAGYENEGTLYLMEAKYAQAIPFLEKALALNPGLQYYSNLGIAYFYVKRYSDAVKTFQKAAELGPNQETDVGNLAEAYFLLGQKKNAMETFNRAVALAYKALQVNPRDADTMSDLATYLAYEGQPAQALQFIRDARSIDPASSQYVYNEAEVQTIAGKTGLALKSLRKAFQRGIPPQQAMTDPELNNLQNNPELLQLVKQFSGK